MGSVLSLFRWIWNSLSSRSTRSESVPPESPPTPPHPPLPYGTLSFSPALHTAQPFPGRPSMSALEFLKEACPDAHAYTSEIIHTSMGEEIEDVIPQRNGFVHTVLGCYNEHRALTIRPDDVWTSILTQFSCYVNGNAEALRSLFVLHYDKKELTVTINPPQGKESWGFVVETLTGQMEDQILGVFCK